MSDPNRGRPRRRRRVARIEGLEPRELPSLTPFLYRAASAAQHGGGAGVQALAGGASGGSGSAGTGSSSGGGTSVTTPTGQPTPHELIREHFTAKLAGTYTVGPGRFSDQAAQVRIIAEGNANQFLHAEMQAVIFTPADAANGTTTGEVNLYGRNVSNTGSALDLELSAPPPNNRLGLPTQYTWTVGGNSGGLYAGATGSGTMTVTFTPGGSRVGRRATGAGRVAVVVQGYVDTSGVGNVQAGPGNRPTNP